MDETKTKSESDRLGLPSASSAERIYQCAGSWEAEQLVPASETSTVVAEEGDDVHAAMETGDTTGLGMTTGEIADALKRLEDKVLEEWAVSRGGTPPETDTLVEERMWLRDEHGKKVTSAKLDKLHIWEKDALIIDWKTGYKPVTDASTNWQVRVQAMVVAQNFPHVTRIRVVLAQHRFKSTVTAADYTEDDILMAMEDWKLALWRSKQPYAQRVPGKWCEYCRAKNNCVQAAAYAMLPMALPGSSDLSDEAAAELRRKKSLIEGILKSVDTRLKALPEERLAELGYELTESGHTTTIKDPIEAFTVLEDAKYITDREFMLTCKPSVVKLRDIVVPRIMERFKISKVNAVEALENLLAEQIEKKNKQPQLREL